MYQLLRRFRTGIGILVLVACGTPTSDVRTPIIPTLTASVIVPTATVPVATATAVAVTTTTDPTTDASTSVTMPSVTIPAPTATTVAVTATMVPTTDANATDIDILAYRTADGYHAFGNANAPVVLTDYSDFF